MDDVVLAKADIIERCTQRVRTTYAVDPAGFGADADRQDVVVLNLQRACEAAIDLAMHLVRVERLGVPTSSRDAFDLLERGGILDARLAAHLRGMVGFRNIAVHNYRALDLAVVESALRDRLDDLLSFAQLALERR